MPTYPQDLPLVEIREALSFITSGGVGANKERFAQDLWWIQGYAQKMIIGDVRPLTTASAQAAFDPVAALKKLEASAADGTVMAQGLFDWQSLAIWAAEELLKTLKEWLMQ